MIKQQIKALEGSVQKWEKIVAGTGADKGNKDCPCCKLWANPFALSSLRCEGCPIKEESGERGCKATPWMAWSDHHFKSHDAAFAPYSLRVQCPKCKTLAKKELAFLKKLLKKHHE